MSERHFACFATIGQFANILVRDVAQVTTETKETAKWFVAMERQDHDLNRYFILNVEQRLRDVGLRRVNKTRSHQDGNSSILYLDDQQQFIGVRNYANSEA